ncbi:pheromone-regulated protein PRM4 [Saccharomyces paradoxus]|uniref:Pheromone-regulated protein PRM4 n=1 Tax=Saccharomyces paradoxus TaxID=27291 RepID=A0A8B8V0S2_SACPA|nr:Prm4 [Saccharomyces paradoxus]QHS76582.1 Prm4 [Saccharomyces paradoxus]
MIADSSALKKRTSTKRSTRIISLTLVLLGIVSFLVLTWNDSLEFYSNAAALNENSKNNKEESEKKFVYKLPNLLKTADNFLSKENELNFLKVKEEISHIQSEVEVDIPAPSSKVTSTFSPTSFHTGDILARITTTTISPQSSSLIMQKNCDHKRFDPKTNFLDIIRTSPAVLLIKSSQTDSIFLKNLLQREFEISPELAIVDLEKHSHGYELEKYIKQNKLSIDPSAPLESIQSPYLFLNGISVINNGMVRDIIEPHSKGLLLSILKSEARGNLLVEKKDIPSNS